MIGLGFIFRVIEFLTAFAVACILLLLFVYVLSKGVQLTAKALGYEMGDFFSWAKTLFPKRKRNRK